MQVLTNLKFIILMEQGMFEWGGPKGVVGLGVLPQGKKFRFLNFSAQNSLY